MAKTFLIRTATKCGVCLADNVYLLEGSGTHALVELDAHNMKVPHVCPPAFVRKWLAYNQAVRDCAELARLAVGKRSSQ